MKQPKKRWARTEAQQRRDVHGHAYWHNPTSAWAYERLAWKKHRQRTKCALALITSGVEEELTKLPFHHRHDLLWNYH